MNINKYLILMIGILSQTQSFAQDTEKYCRKYLKDLEAQRAQLSSNQSYGSNPYYQSKQPYTSTQSYRNYGSVDSTRSQQSKADVVQVLKNLQERLGVNHQNCQSRQDCMRADIAAINKFRDENHEVGDIINRFKEYLKKQYESDVLATELSVYQQLTPAGQQLYNSGIHLKMPDQVNVNNQTSQERVYYNADEMLIAVIQQLSKAHQSCGSRQSCLKQDVQLLANLQQQYPEDQRFVKQVDGLVKLINTANNKDVFATMQFLSSYIAHLQSNQPVQYVSKAAESFEAIQSKVSILAKKRSVELDKSKHKPLAAKDKARERAKETGKEVLNTLIGKDVATGSTEEVKPKKLIHGFLGKLLGL